MQKSVVEKLEECRELYIQNLEKGSIQKNMVFMFLKEQKLDSDVRNLTINPKQGLVKLEFTDHKKAELFYDKFNFEGPTILIRPFNIYFGLQLADAEMKKYYLEGITDENQRKLFEAARKIGICKLYTNYTQATRGKLKPKGVLSFIRKEELTEDQFKQLSTQLLSIGIKVDKYIAEKDLKCSIKVTNFFKGDTKQDDDNISAEGEKELRARLEKVWKDKPTNITVAVRRRQIPSEQGSEEKVDPEILVSAILEFSSTDITIENFELIRQNILEESKLRAILFFHNDENNSYMSLFTSGLLKPENLSEKQFEDKLINDFRKVNGKVVQVNIYPVKRNGTYIGRVYLNTEEEGKNFIVDYTAKRDLIMSNYQNKNQISFNINVDSKTLGKIKLAERKATEITNRIKMADESVKRNKRNNAPGVHTRIPIGYPMQNLPGNIMAGPGGMPAGPNMMPQGMNLPPQGPMGSNIPPPNMGMGMGMGMGGMGMGIAKPNYKEIASKFIRDRDLLMKDSPINTKRILYPCLKHFIEENDVSPAESQFVTDRILQKLSVGEVISILENPQDLKARIKDAAIN